jgi:DNA-binding transcriptional ArsR family regulator
MGKVHFPQDESGRLAPHLAEKLDRELQDALDHPMRRETLRTLHRHVRSLSAPELRGALHAFHSSQVSYHLQVLQRSGIVAAAAGPMTNVPAQALYASEVTGDRKVQAILRATEDGDRERREAAAAANASPLLTMFRVPRPARTLRLRGRSKVDAEQDR